MGHVPIPLKIVLIVWLKRRGKCHSNDCEHRPVLHGPPERRGPVPASNATDAVGREEMKGRAEQRGVTGGGSATLVSAILWHVVPPGPLAETWTYLCNQGETLLPSRTRSNLPP